ncbi:hypothetical protein [Flavobacterium sp. HBTb2-11-1]|uniref:hypothetical protein n=1 Tax=Flavobacterium sp. HBTb2-11-1 TaxID=2692212 RepID=UPI00136AB464|nr:hypothetical protein [Flavobacterium sp. HBTb2-11-1]MXO04125.1 hypothetical protein [Flavobacterium sp. HBTb2-11-1]
MKKKSINELRLDKNVISKFSAKMIKGGGGDTYTCADSPMTSCNGKCGPVQTHATAAAQTCVESVDIGCDTPPFIN